MSDGPLGDGWWEASDGKWYAPELHPDYKPPAPVERPGIPPAPVERPGIPPAPVERPGIPPAPGLGDFERPIWGERVDALPPPTGWSAAPGQGLRYPVVAPKKRSTGRILAFVFGGLFLLMAGGCGVLIWSYRDEIADATIDFTDAAPVDDPATCRVIGVDFGEDYEIEATLTAVSAEVESHYQVAFEVVGPDGSTLGVDETVFRAMAPGEERTEDVFNVIPAAEPVNSVSCAVTGVLRTGA